MADENFEELINDIKKSYEVTNLQECNLNLLEPSIEQKLGYLLQNIPNNNSREYTINFDPVETIFLQKLIREETLNKKVVVTKEQFFKSIVFLDFLTDYILHQYDILNDFKEITERLEQIDTYLDPDLDVIVNYSALYFAINSSRMIRFNGTQSEREDIQRYERRNHSCAEDYIILRKLNPLYGALGCFITDLIDKEEIKQELPYASGINDVKSLIFVDCVLGYLPEESKNFVVQKITDKHYFSAAKLALDELGKNISPRYLADYYEDKINIYRGRDAN